MNASGSHAPDPPGPSTADQLEGAYERVGLTRAHLGVVAMVLFGVFFDAVEQNTVGIAGPILMREWHLNVTHIGLLNTATFTAVALGRVIAGALMDVVGRRRLLSVNLVVFALGSFFCAATPNYEVLVAARFLVGIGLGGEIAAAVVILSEFFSARHRGTATALVNVAAGGFGNMLAPLFGVVVLATFSGPGSWRWIFGLLVLPALMVVVYRRALPESPRYLVGRGRTAEANVVFNRLGSGRLRGPVVSDVVYLTTSATVGPPEDRTDRIGPLRRPYRRRTAALGVAVCMSYAAQFTMITLVPIILTSRGMPISKALWFTLAMQFGSLMGACVAALLARRMPRKRVLTAGAVIGAVAGIGFGFLATDHVSVVLFGAVFNFAVIVLNTTIWVFTPEQYPTAIRGLATAMILAVGSLSGGLVALVAAALLDAFGVGAVFAMLSASFLVCAVAARFPPETFGTPMPEDELR